ncbi:metalloregulator ArsR/SmtB family transcription factor [Bengtsoniella intestinalis]|uniref:ArsR/SmtB family transcription factor n=1 Tax=Bengtsoniella intestinalis TaxID=3073143 RepID=UPI00391F0C6D
MDTPTETCCQHHLEHNPTARVKALLPQDEDLLDLADLFKLFSDGTRVKILYALLESELCVCDLAEVLNMTQSAISHQLRTLRSGKMVKFRRGGSTIYYSLADDHIFRILEQGMTHVKE